MNAAVAAPAAGNNGVTTSSVSPNELPDDFDPMVAAQEADAAVDATIEKPQARIPEKPENNAKPGEKGAQKPNETAKPGEPGAESTAAKEAKEIERRDRSWKALDQEKQQFRTEKTQILSRVESLQRELAQLKQSRSAEPVKDEHGFTADVYERLEKKLRDDGDDEKADAARTRADNLRRKESVARSETKPEGTREQGEPWKSPEFQTEWQRHTSELIADEPELGDPQNPLVKAANTLLQDKTWAPYFLARPDGIKAAVEVAKLLHKSHEIDAAREELKTAKAEVERLTKLTQPRGSHPSAPPNTSPKAVSEMTEDDIMEAAKRADESG